MDIKSVVVQLSDCCEIIVGRNIDKSKLNECGVGIPYIVGASDMKLGQLDPKRYCSAEIRNPVYSESGDLLISIVGTLGKMAVNTVGRVILSGHVCAVRIKGDVSRHYVMAMVSRLILEAIPDSTGAIMGFQSKLNIDRLKQIRFALPNLVVQDWLVCRLTSIASIILASKDSPDIYLDPENLANTIDRERSTQRAHMRKMSTQLEKLRDLLVNLPQDSETINMINETESTMKRLLKIQ